MIITIGLVAKNHAEQWSESSRELKNDVFPNILPRDFFGAVSLLLCQGKPPPFRALSHKVRKPDFMRQCPGRWGLPLAQSEADCAKEVPKSKQLNSVYFYTQEGLWTSQTGIRHIFRHPILHAFVGGPRVEGVVNVIYCTDAKRPKRAKRAASELEAVNSTHKTC